MFASTTQTWTFFFVPDAARASDRSVPQQVVTAPPSATAPVRVTWLVR